MRIGLNLLYLRPGIVGGTETYAMGLLKGLAELNSPDEFFIFLSRDAKDWALPDRKNFSRVVCEVHASRRGMRYVYEQTILPRLAKKYSLDVLHSLGYTGPLRTPCKSVITIPDMNYVAFGSQIPLLRRTALRCFVRLGARTADHLIAISKFSRDEIQNNFQTPAEKVTAIYIAPHPDRENPSTVSNDELLREFHLLEPYWVAFSSESPNKNIPNLLRAISKVRKNHKLGCQLVLIGHKPKTRESTRMLDGEGCEGVVSTGYINDKDVSTILSGAQMLIFPSFYEGFGLPVVEAMACGVPVICSNAASLPEVAGNAALYFDPTNPDDIADKIALLTKSGEQRELMRQKGYENAKRFSWGRTAIETMRVYQHVCGN